MFTNDPLIKFWRPFRAEGRPNLTDIEYRMDLKMVSNQPQWILMNYLQLLFESVIVAILSQIA
jgi:hypothetical protein